MSDETSNPTPPAGPSTVDPVTGKVKLLPRRQGDELQTWRSSLCQIPGTKGLQFGVKSSPQAPAIAYTPDSSAADYVGLRMSRAAYLENNLVAMIASLIRFINANPATGIDPRNMVDTMVRMYNEQPMFQAEAPAANEQTH